jgi:hypothetical protein
MAVPQVVVATHLAMKSDAAQPWPGWGEVVTLTPLHLTQQATYVGAPLLELASLVHELASSAEPTAEPRLPRHLSQQVRSVGAPLLELANLSVTTWGLSWSAALPRAQALQVVTV